LRYIARIAVFIAIALAGVYAGEQVIWSLLIPFPIGPIILLAALFFVFRVLRRYFDAADGVDRGNNYVLTESLWTSLVAGCLFGGLLAGMLAYNPDGYMQPGPDEPPWELIRLGSYAGAVAATIMCTVVYVVSRLRQGRV
jgi:hypothetical protein